MPSAMIHLLVAGKIPGGEDPLFRLGSLAPDYLTQRAEKDAVHLRLEPDRFAALQKLAGRLDLRNPFDAGWLVHLLADLRWDTEVIPAFRASVSDGADWFPLYRKESHRAGYALYHRSSWGREAMRAVLEADLNALHTALEVDLPALEEFRRMLFRKHEESPADSRSPHFPPEMLERFALETAEEAAKFLPQ